ncbi:unnamed protein product [Diatraea saccharalis]|uniref:Microtubule-associated protein Jupiter n=1 Tax=Diatraea saccharalis TaxID=40085 RepID=A0A9N9RBN8_9NEOP|nr:unnamed protein product [Diatraea saccharalis]
MLNIVSDITMTSTSFNVGLTDNTRLSSRVLRPPGGGHTDIFGGEPEPQRGRRPAPSVIAAQQAEQQKQTNGTEDATQNGQATQPEQQAAEPQTPPTPQTPPEPKPAAESLKTESPQAHVPQPEPAKVEPPRRQRVPPGGFSSGLW